MLEVVVRLISDDHPDKASWLDSFGDLLLTRCERFGELVCLGKLVSVGEEAVRLIADGDPNKPSRLNKLGYSSPKRYDRSGEVVDLEKSIPMTEGTAAHTRWSCGQGLTTRKPRVLFINSL